MKTSKTTTVSVHWEDDAQSITVYTLAASWTWGDLFTAVDHAREFENSVSYRMDALIDATRPTEMPFDFFNNMRQIVWKQPKNIHLTIIATPSRAFRMWLKAAGNIIPVIRRDYRVVDTVEEALAIIEADRVRVL